MEIVVYWAVIILGLPLVIFLLGREAYVWWLNRHTRRSMAAIRKMEEQHYADEARAAVRYAEDYLRELRECS